MAWEKFGFSVETSHDGRGLCFLDTHTVRAGIFIERDGILNRVRVHRGIQVSPLTLDEFRVNRNALPALRELKAAGLVLVATTNQPGLSRGYQLRGELDRMHAELRGIFPLDDILVCPHDEGDDCPCRKPRPGLLEEAAFEWQLELDRSFVISDKWQDAEAARAAGCTSLLIQSPWVKGNHHDFVLPDLPAVVGKILHFQTAGSAPVA
jgi:D-glycero-D-manno-heptose 1,7-bisphosphate phosphatase